MELTEIRDRASAAKPQGADLEWADLSRAYADQSRSNTRSTLAAAGVGLKENKHPLDMGGLLRQIIDRSATVYARAPARWLTRNGKRLREDDPQHKLLLAAYAAAQIDTTWRKADRLRSLLGQVVLRFYPSDERKAVVARIFEPQQVHRVPDPACSDLVDHDQAFALELSGGVFEVWDRLEDRSWRMRWLNDKGAELPLEAQPFRTEPGLRSPYPKLPVQQVYVDLPNGAWIPPRLGRLGWLEAMAMIANDVLALSVFQAHNTRVFKRNNPNSTLASDTGPGAVINIKSDEEVMDLTPSPAIDQLIAVLGVYGRLFSTTESLPGNELDPQKQILTGAALRVQLQPLIDLREGQVPLVVPDEQSAFERFRGVYNLHCKGWGLESIDPVLGLELEVPDLETPATETELGNLAARQLALGTASTIDLIQRETGATRDEAIRRHKRVAADGILYPPPVNPGAQQSGPRMAGVNAEPGPTAPDNSPDAALDGKPSVVSSIAKGAA